MIPNIIHYCWFGRNPLPQLAIKCIESWKKFLPEYEIKEWNEDNFDVKTARISTNEDKIIVIPQIAVRQFFATSGIRYSVL